MMTMMTTSRFITQQVVDVYYVLSSHSSRPTNRPWWRAGVHPVSERFVSGGDQVRLRTESESAFRADSWPTAILRRSGRVSIGWTPNAATAETLGRIGTTAEYGVAAAAQHWPTAIASECEVWRKLEWKTHSWSSECECGGVTCNIFPFDLRSLGGGIVSQKPDPKNFRVKFSTLCKRVTKVQREIKFGKINFERHHARSTQSMSVYT